MSDIQELSKYAVEAWIGNEDGTQRKELVIQLNIAESLIQDRERQARMMTNEAWIGALKAVLPNQKEEE